MAINKIVARFQDGRVLKGESADFMPSKDHFHLAVVGAVVGSKATRIVIAQLKAVFFVKDLVGDPRRTDRSDFDGPVAGRKLRVVFRDGEVMVGSTQGYQPGRPGFFLSPADRSSNIERAYIVAAATSAVTLL